MSSVLPTVEPPTNISALNTESGTNGEVKGFTTSRGLAIKKQSGNGFSSRWRALFAYSRNWDSQIVAVAISV
ncbi:hypothetical protein N7457_000939 [Penicillium paradoxum]|uniref:uncharacterized protein n=1 Tax=Penicillium paradoxum TaxID=176176 RepID=UPI0025491F2E|nr:uncharacterized protein N7457_000939 [Penicillium paradoxum]KAJ5794340.1 hypothetical protein N7457_000939 [Penicillium paradoxum]